MSTRPRGRSPESRGPSATEGVDAVDEYLVALDEVPLVDVRSLAVLERDFVLHAKHFADRRGITYEAWRDVGVSQHVLARAGIYEVVVV